MSRLAKLFLSLAYAFLDLALQLFCRVVLNGPDNVIRFSSRNIFTTHVDSFFMTKVGVTKTMPRRRISLRSAVKPANFCSNAANRRGRGQIV